MDTYAGSSLHQRNDVKYLHERKDTRDCCVPGTRYWYTAVPGFFKNMITFTFQLLARSYEGGSHRQRSSGQAVVTGVVPSHPPRCVSLFIFISHRIQHSFPLLVDLHRIVRFPRIMQEKIPASIHSARLEPTSSRHVNHAPSHEGRRQRVLVSMIAR